MPDIETIRPLIERKLQSMEMDLYDLKFVGAGRHSALKVYIDRPSGVTIDDCERASTAISVLLDVEGFSERSYTLEVSSPGIDRPLRTAREFRRGVNRRVTIQLRQPIAERRSMSGTILGCDNGVLTLDIDGVPAPVPLEVIDYGLIDFAFK